ncbi:MAG: SusD/RagB family nutrient-binding outer membrane lipoprotein [Alistipes sp.]|jgi:hypothetical protein|nr:SusD/RagB family nutrient-binding outer membrane lipoprotein [Alistipes sp.]
MKKILYSFFVIPAVALWGCANFDDLNVNPAASTDMDPLLMIPTIQMMQTENHQEWARYLSYPAGFMNQWTGSWGVVEYGGRGILYDNYSEQMWMSYYPAIVRDVVDVVYRTTGDESKVNLNAIARILKVQIFHRLTDMYGDIPYFDAGKGYTHDVIMPAYDPQSEIYPDLLKELREASEALDPAADAVPNDLYYRGDIARWKKFANSLRLRLAMRLVKVDPATAKSEAEAAIAAGVFTSNADLCYIQHEEWPYDSGGPGKGNAIAVRLQSPDETLNTYRLTTELVRQMENTGDPRLMWYGRAYCNAPRRTDITDIVRSLPEFTSYTSMALDAQRWGWDVWVGNIEITIGTTPVTLTNGEWRLQPSGWVNDTASPYIHLSYAEVELLMAEAAFRGWNTGGTARDHYTKGLEAAVRQWSLWNSAFMGGSPVMDETAIQNFLTNNVLVAGNEMNLINTQLWVLHFLNPHETWANWRRTGYPDLYFHNFEPARNQTNGLFPRRLPYPIEEQMKNEVNYNDVLSRMGGTDDWTKRVWWDAIPASGAPERDDIN